ncbi:MAG TPA: xanthine dehydrogenase family protein subunit M [Acidobacteriota bacterium]|nr:xanthine dehydrogenase family protein subunit M [Acidobacteriota bacterium]
MFSSPFQYRRAHSLEEAFRLFESCQDAKYLAGGHSLLPAMKLRLAQPAHLIDIGRIPQLAMLEEEGDKVHIGGLVTHARLCSEPLILRHSPLLSQAARQIADPQVRNRGTVGGNLAHADPASDLPAVMLALDGRFHLQGPHGHRTVAARDFFLDLFTTALQEGEILTAVEIEKRPGWGNSYLKYEHPASGYAVCAAACSLQLNEEGECSGLSLCFNGVSAVPFQARQVTEALVGERLARSRIEEAVQERLEVPDPLQDSFASGPYRARMAKVYAIRALTSAHAQASSPRD